MRPYPLRTRLLHLLLTSRGSVADVADVASLRVSPPPGRLTDLLRGPVEEGVGIADASVPTREGRRVPLRVYRPEAQAPGSAPLVVFLHGGGWTLGAPADYDSLCSHLAARVGAVVASVDYRLAPEHPAPAAIEDSLDAVRYLHGSPESVGARPGPLALAGDSAGGNLTAVTTQTLRDAGEGDVVAAQVLLYPATDSTCLRRSRIEYAHGPVLTRRDTDAFFAHYLGTGPGALSPTDRRISPLLGDLHGLPSALVQLGGIDPLRDEGRAYADALAAAGGEVVCTEYPACPHGFASAPGACVGAWPHRDEIVAFLRERLPR